MNDDEIEALLSKIFHPSRARRRTVGAIYRACDDALTGSYPSEVIEGWWLGRESARYDEYEAAAVAWEALAARGLIPMDWCDDPRRQFATVPAPVWCARCGRGGCAHSFEQRRRVPWRLRDCAVFASDPEGVRAAEALAEQLCREAGEAFDAGVSWATLEAHAAVLVGGSYEARLLARTVPPTERALLATGYAFSGTRLGVALLLAALV